MKFKNLLLLLVCLLFVACDDSQPKNEWHSSAGIQNSDSVTSIDDVALTIGDIDPDTPTNRMRKIRPLADLIAHRLDWDESRVKVRIASSIDEIVLMIKEGRVDLYIDSSYPSMLVQRSTGSKIILESLVNGDRSYRSMLIARTGSNINTPNDLVGKKLVFQEQYSTSGYLLPATLLINTGFTLVEIADQYESVPEGTIGYLFSGDEENTFTMVRKGIVAAGAISSIDYEKLTPEQKKEFLVLAKTSTVPRKLASIRSGVDPEIRNKLIKALLSINDDERKKMHEQNGWNWQFINLDSQSQEGLSAINSMIDTIDVLAPN